MRHAPLLIAILFATVARADGERPLHLAVHGSVDTEVLGPSLSRELGVEVVVVDGRCDVPCLDVTVDGKNTATVIYAPRIGSSRQRTIKLGTDTSQWPLVITLLAGNVVRDEARVVLDELPARDLPRPARPPAPGEVPPAPPDADEPDADEPDAVDAPGDRDAPGRRGAPDRRDAPDGREAPDGRDAPDGREAPARRDTRDRGDAPDAEDLPPHPEDELAPPDGWRWMLLPPPAGGDEEAVPAPPDEAPPAAPPAAPAFGPPAAWGAQAPAPESPRRHRLLAVGIVPGLSTDLLDVGAQHFLSFHLLVGVAGGSSGLSVSGIADVQRGLVAGFQVGGVAAVARRVAGVQAAGIAAVAGDVDGVQAAGTAAVADRVDGIQAGGIAAFSRGNAAFQAAGIAAVARGPVRAQAGGIAAVAGGDAGIQGAGIAAVARDAGIQAGGIAAVAGRDANFQVGGIAAAAGRDANVQVGGITSVARGTANIQAAGLVNVARRLRGVQLAPINVARENDGIQIGVLNVGGSPDGFSFGLINIVPGGRYDLEGAIDSDRIGTVLFRHGGRRWHNVYGIAGHAVDEARPSDRSDDVWMYGLGFGPSLTFHRTVIDLEAIGWQVNHGARHETDVSILGQLRLSVAHRVGPFAVVAGGILNAYITSDPQSPLVLERRTDAAMDRSVTVTTWPSAFVGLRI